MAEKYTSNTFYGNILDSIKSYRGKITAYTAGIEGIQHTIYKNLTNIDDAIANGKMAKRNGETLGKIFINLTELIKLAAGKPYLVSILSKTTPIILGRTAHLTKYVKDFIKGNDPKALIDQTQRDKLLYQVFTDIQIIYNLTEAMKAEFGMYNLQKQIEGLIPYKDYFNKDKIIVERIIGNYEF